MRSGELSGMVLAFVFLFCHLSFAESEQQLRRYLLSDLAGNGSSWASCGQCLHGSCSYGTHNGHFTRVCRCHDGWTGDACDKHIADDGRCRHASDCTTVTCNQGDKVVCYLNKICACVPERSGHSIDDRNLHCGQHRCTYGSCSYRQHNGVEIYRCTCNHGWTGHACDTRIENTDMTGNHGSSQANCGLHQCIHGSCSYSMQDGIELYHSCKCHHGWTGDACDKSTAAQTTQSPNLHQAHYYESACNNHGQMTSSGCNCHDSWSGDICQYPPGSSHYDYCHQHCAHGTCVGYDSNNGYSYNCKCDHGWHGSYCTQEYAPTQTTQNPIVHQPHYYEPACNNHGQMTSSGCNCHDSWSGDICQYPPGSGHYDHCHQRCVHGTCVGHHGNNGYYYNCKCDHGWHGSYCTQEYAPHGTLQCHNTYCVHGTCGYLKDQSGHLWNYHCVCRHGWDGKHCDQQLTTVSSTTHSVTSPITQAMSSSTTTQTTTTQKTTMQTTLPPASASSSYAPTSTPLSTKVTTLSISSVAPLSSCDHISTLSAIARQTPVANQNAIECSPGSSTSHEAFVLTECSVSQNPSLWQQDVNVMADCGSSAAIPTYTPIAAYDHGLYSSVGSLSGIFLGCTTNGFKIALQTCGQAPHITELQLGGSNTQNPNMYYTIS